jgi:ubiquinone biosynthesis monooxygenase Coq7
MITKRNYSLLDKLLIEANAALTALYSQPDVVRTNPADTATADNLTAAERKMSAALMRVNHSGEICAQALYQGQLCTVRSEITREMLTESRDEEVDHLAWTAKRIAELGGHTSYLNAFWYINAFFIGAVAGLWGDRWSLGFVEETEKQVAAHLTSHLQRLPDQDVRSRKIVEQMREDEMKHGQAARNLNAADLPLPIQLLMKCHAKIMTFIAFRI